MKLFCNINEKTMMKYALKIISDILGLFSQEFRRSQEPKNRSHIGVSYYNLLKMYNSTLLREKLKGTFEAIDVRENDEKYPGLRVTYNHSTIFLG